MKFTIEYIPLNKIKTDSSLKITDNVKKLRLLMWDCLHVLVVRKSNKDNTYTVLGGQSRYDYIKKYTNLKYIPCIIEKNEKQGFKAWLSHLRNKESVDTLSRFSTSWSIVKSFLKKEPQFNELSKIQQCKVLLMALRYKRTVIASMRNEVKQLK